MESDILCDRLDPEGKNEIENELPATVLSIEYREFANRSMNEEEKRFV